MWTLFLEKKDTDEFNISCDIIGDDIKTQWTVIKSLEAVSELTQQSLSAANVVVRGGSIITVTAGQLTSHDPHDLYVQDKFTTLSRH